MILRILSIWWFFVLGMVVQVNGQIHINEICASNRSVLSDEFGETPDWIELYNDGEEDVLLSSVYISDHVGEWDKGFIEELWIPAKSFALLYASGRELSEDENHMNFKLSSEGEGVYLWTESGQLLDSVRFPEMGVDFSYGYAEDGKGEFVLFEDPTPGYENVQSSPFVNLNPPVLTYESGMYSSEIDIRLVSNPNNNVCRFTIDGTKVTRDSPVFEPMKIGETTNMRLAFFDENGHKGKEKVVVYFFEHHNLPIVHLSVEDKKYFDEEIGILRKGPDAEEEYPFYGANFWKDIEVPTTFTYFEENQLKVEYQLATKIHGGKASRTSPMQSIRLIAEEEYGIEEMEYAFFDESDNSEFKRLILRNASGDYNYTHFRDGYLARYFAREKLDLDLIQFDPAVVYINGAYYGLLHLREKIDVHYIEEHYGYDKEEIDLLEKDTQIVQGSFDLFDTHVEFLMTSDLTDDAVFETVESLFDVDHLIDYVTVQSVINNTDWPRNNIKYWRKKEDGKWRYFLFDMDVSMGRYGWTTVENNYLGEWVDTLSNARFYDMLLKLWENESYKNRFVTRYCDLLNSTFKSEQWLQETIDTKERLEPEIKRQFDKWPSQGFEWWQEYSIPKLYEFAEQREPYARSFLQQRFNFTNAERIMISTFPEGAGYMHVNTIQAHAFPWEGYYFNELTTQLEAKDHPGFTFSHWEIIGQTDHIEDGRILTISNFEDMEIIAHYTGSFQGPSAIVYPNPTEHAVSIDFLHHKRGPVSIEILNPKGAEVFTKQFEDIPAGQQSITVETLNLNSGLYFIKINLEEYTETLKLIISNEN